MRNVLLAIASLSRLPLGRIDLAGADPRRAAAHFPLVGYLAFAVFAAAHAVCGLLFPDPVIPRLLSLTAVYLLFNLFHFDGFMDSLDGLLCQRPRERKLEVMRSGAAGPMAVAGAVFYLALKMYLVVRLAPVYLLAAFVLSRWGAVLAATIARPARTDGQGARLLPVPGIRLAVASLYLLPLAAILYLPVLLPFAAAALTTALVVAWHRHSLGGITGDGLGMVIELNELAVLLAVLGGLHG